MVSYLIRHFRHPRKQNTRIFSDLQISHAGKGLRVPAYIDRDRLISLWGSPDNGLGISLLPA